MGDLNWSDLSGQGHWGILVSTSDDGKLYCLEPEGSVRWVFSPPLQRFAGSVSVCQPRSDLSEKLVVVGTRYTKIFAVDDHGRVRWEEDLPVNSIHSGPVVIGPPGSQAILYAGDAGRLFALTASGEVLWYRAVPGPVHGTPAAGDVDGDGRAEIFFGCKDSYLYSLRCDGSLRWRAETRKVGDGITTSPILADLDGDGRFEVVCGSWDGHAYCFDAETGKKLWSTELKGRIRNGLTVSDLNGDGRYEVLVGDPFGLACLLPDGSIQWEFRPDRGEMTVSVPPIVGDVTGNGEPDIVFGTQTGFLYAVDRNGREIWSIDLVDEEIAASPLLADVDGDGLIEVVYATSYGKVVCLSTPSRTPPLWPMGRRMETLNPGLAPVGSIPPRRQTRRLGKRTVGRGESRHVLIRHIRPKNVQADRPTLHWECEKEYTSLQLASPLRLYAESRDPDRPVGGQLEVSVGEASQYSTPVKPPSGSVLVEVGLGEASQPGLRELTVAAELRRGGETIAEAYLQLRLLDAREVQDALTSVEWESRAADTLAKENGDQATYRLLERCLSYARDDLGHGLLGRAITMAEQIHKRATSRGLLRRKRGTAAPRRVCIDSRGVIAVDGRPFFPIGIYLVSTGQQVRSLARLGFNVMFSAGDEEFRDACLQSGVMFIPFGPGENVEDFESILTARDRVEELCSHPSLLAWYVVDEPSLRNVPVELVRRACEIVKTVDPLHPTLICDGYPYRGLPYQALADIASPCWYPVWKQMSLTTTARCLDDIAGVIPRSQPLWYVLEAWTWRDVRFPTPEEERVMTYLSIIHGARGVSWFGYTYPHREHLLTAHDASPELWNEILRIVKELNELSDILATPRVPPRISRDHGRVDWCLIEKDGRVLVVAANPTTRPATAGFDVGPLRGGEVSVLWEDRRLELSKGRFCDSFDPLSVHLYIGNREGER